MDSRYFIALSIATLVGGLVGSFGFNFLIKRPGVSRLIRRWRWWGLGAFYLAAAAAVFGGLAWVVQFVLANVQDASAFESPLLFFGFGLIVGLPFTVPTVTGVWQAARSASAKTKAKPASRQDRIKFAQDLEKQLKEFVEDSRPVEVMPQGEDADILLLGGGFTRQEGERLVAALRADLLALNVKRVEGGPKDSKWWVRVALPAASTQRKKRSAR